MVTDLRSIDQLDKQLLGESVVWVMLHKADRAQREQSEVMIKIDELLDFRLILMKMRNGL
jgi:hypothetical protein